MRYRYRCPVCGHEEEQDRPMAEAALRPPCPLCTGENGPKDVVLMERVFEAAWVPPDGRFSYLAEK